MRQEESFASSWVQFRCRGAACGSLAMEAPQGVWRTPLVLQSTHSQAREKLAAHNRAPADFSER